MYNQVIVNKRTTMNQTYKQNRFGTLNEALASENLEHTWEVHFQSLKYGQTFSYTFDDGSKYGLYVSVHRFDDGSYERPVSYKR
jgi:hypothetical protein